MAIKKIFLICCLFAVLKGSAQFWTIGPTFHWYLHKGEKPFAIGPEASYWTYIHGEIPISGDLGIESRGEKTFFYSELQTSLYQGLLPTAGVSAGPVICLENKESVKAGFQASVWSAIFIGADLRYRGIDKKHYFAPGGFGKVIITPPGYRIGT